MDLNKCNMTIKDNRLTPVEFSHRTKSGSYWLFNCSCGNNPVIRISSYKRGDSRSCGCLRDELSTMHGYRKKGKLNPTYSTWRAIKTRCNNPNYIDSHLYLSRNITVCDRWLKFENFLADMGDKPEGTSIDRIDNEKGYYKENCRWATPSMQSDNRRCVKKISFNNQEKTVLQWSKEIGIKRSTLYRRIFVDNWSIEKAFNTPLNVSKINKNTSSENRAMISYYNKESK